MSDSGGESSGWKKLELEENSLRRESLVEEASRRGGLIGKLCRYRRKFLSSSRFGCLMHGWRTLFPPFRVELSFVCTRRRKKGKKFSSNNSSLRAQP